MCLSESHQIFERLRFFGSAWYSENKYARQLIYSLFHLPFKHCIEFDPFQVCWRIERSGAGISISVLPSIDVKFLKFVDCLLIAVFLPRIYCEGFSECQAPSRTILQSGQFVRRKQFCWPVWVHAHCKHREALRICPCSRLEVADRLWIRKASSWIIAILVKLLLGEAIISRSLAMFL